MPGYGDFDSLAAAAVRRQKAVYPHITAILVLAYLNRETDTSRYDDTTYNRTGNFLQGCGPAAYSLCACVGN